MSDARRIIETKRGMKKCVVVYCSVRRRFLFFFPVGLNSTLDHQGPLWTVINHGQGQVLLKPWQVDEVVTTMVTMATGIIEDKTVDGIG